MIKFSQAKPLPKPKTHKTFDGLSFVATTHIAENCNDFQPHTSPWTLLYLLLRLRVVPIFSPSCMTRKDVITARSPWGEERAKEGTTTYAREFELCVALTTLQKYDWLMLGALTTNMLSTFEIRVLQV